MDLHFSAGKGFERIAQRIAVVGERTRIDDQPLGTALLLDEIDDCALVVGVIGANRDAPFFGPLADQLLNLRERLTAVDLRLAQAESVEVRTRDQQHLHPAVPLR